MKVFLVDEASGDVISDIQVVGLPALYDRIVFEGDEGHRKLVVADVIHAVGANKAQIVRLIVREDDE